MIWLLLAWTGIYKIVSDSPLLWLTELASVVWLIRMGVGWLRVPKENRGKWLR